MWMNSLNEDYKLLEKFETLVIKHTLKTFRTFTLKIVFDLHLIYYISSNKHYLFFISLVKNIFFHQSYKPISEAVVVWLV
jgi:hypothetical protein